MEDDEPVCACDGVADPPGWHRFPGQFAAFAARRAAGQAVRDARLGHNGPLSGSTVEDAAP
jgi:hypothetical protein